MTSVNTKLRILKRLNAIKQKEIEAYFEEASKNDKQLKKDALNKNKSLSTKLKALLKAEAVFEKALLDK